MSRSVSGQWTGAPPPNDPEYANNSARGTIVFGIVLLVAFFGGLGGWAATAPLNGAVVANAVVKVDGNRRAVQHMDGGIVKEVLVKEGDTVSVGDLLIRLDDTQARADYEVFDQAYTRLRAREARLQAELLGLQSIEFPTDLEARDDQDARTAIAAQRDEFEKRRQSLSGQKDVLGKRIAQLREQLAGQEAQLVAYRAQFRSISDEEDSLADLLNKGLITRARTLQLQRTRAGLEGQIGSTESAIAADRKTAEGYQQQIEQVDKDRAVEVSKDLSETKSQLLDVESRRQNAAAVLNRTLIKSPYFGEVVDLSVFGAGAVIGRGDKIMDIVPNGRSPTIEARVRVDDIGDIEPGMAAEIHPTAYKQRVMPLIRGSVAKISADRLTDDRTGVPYYLATIDVDTRDLEGSPSIKLHPGMAVTVVVSTTPRTALDYLLGPLAASFDQSFREK